MSAPTIFCGASGAAVLVSGAVLLIALIVPRLFGEVAQRGLGRRGWVAEPSQAGAVRAGAQPRAVLTSVVVPSPRSASCSSAGAVTINALSWFIAWVRALTAPRRATRSARIASTRPSRVFGVPLAVPLSAARAAA